MSDYTELVKVLHDLRFCYHAHEAADAIKELQQQIDAWVEPTKEELAEWIAEIADHGDCRYALVRRGKWIADKEDVEWGNYLIHYRCSECKERPHFDKDKYKFILSPYCPNCGAKMDGGQSNV